MDEIGGFVYWTLDFSSTLSVRIDFSVPQEGHTQQQPAEYLSRGHSLLSMLIVGVARAAVLQQHMGIEARWTYNGSVCNTDVLPLYCYCLLSSETVVMCKKCT